MKRLPGIVFSAIVLLLGSLFQIVLAVGMGAAGVVEKTQILSSSNPATGVTVSHSTITPAAVVPSWMPVFMYVLAGFIVVLALWGILTSIGLFRMHRWARVSVVIIGGCLAVMGIPAMLMSIALLFIPLPMPGAVDAAQAGTVHSYVKVVFGIIAAVYGAVGGIGVFWLIYFNLKKVRAAFAGQFDTFVPGPRPLLISVIAVLNMLGIVAMVLMVSLSVPGAFMVWILEGWRKVVFGLAYAVLMAATAYGLWHMKEWGRRLAIAMQCLGLAQYITFLARPSIFTTYNAQIQRMMKLPQQVPPPAQFNQEMIYLSMGLGIVFLLAIIFILHYYRGRFRAPVLPPQTIAPALP